MRNFIVFVLSAVTATIITAFPVGAVTWESLGFIKMLSSDPNHYNLQFNDHLISAAHYDSIDAMGINVISSALGIDSYYEILSPNKNRYLIPVYVSTSVYQYEDPPPPHDPPSIETLCKGIAFKKPAAVWENTIAINDYNENPNYGHAIEWELNPGEYVIQANPYPNQPGFGAGIVAYTNSEQSLEAQHPDITQHKCHLVNPGERTWYFNESSPCLIEVQVWTHITEYTGTDSIFKIELWEGNRNDPTWHRVYYFIGDDNIPVDDDTIYFQITNQPYDWHTLVDMNDSQEGICMHKRHKIQIDFESLGETNINIYIDSIAVYDSLGYVGAYNHFYNPTAQPYIDFTEDVDFLTRSDAPPEDISKAVAEEN